METLKKILIYISLPIVGLLIMYLPMSFYWLEPNPLKWNDSTRLLFALEGMVFFIAGIVVAVFINNTKQLND